MNICSAETWAGFEGEFIALWTDETYAYALFKGELLAVELVGGGYPALSLRYPGASWFERLAKDSWGHEARGAHHTATAVEHFRGPDGHGVWPVFESPHAEGVHQIAVGPIHAGIIEPGHFRFSVVGERILKLEARLGYSHKGILGLMRGKSPRLAARFAARVSGDSTVAHGLAFAHAAESALRIEVPERARWLRAVMAELERIASHASDIGAIAGDAGFAFLDARLAWHRESFCAAAQAAFGHRLMMDMVIPGGVAADIAAAGPAAIFRALDALELELPSLTRVFEDYASLQDRLVGTGTISSALARSYAAGGFVGRASGRREDARRDPGYAPYDAHQLAVPVETQGDVAARIRIRLAEIPESVRLVRLFLDLPRTAIATAVPHGSGMGLGVAETFRGAAWHWLRLESGLIKNVFIADPSALHWPLLEHAALNGIVADFPLINKSINASYSGVDL